MATLQLIWERPLTTAEEVNKRIFLQQFGSKLVQDLLHESRTMNEYSALFSESPHQRWGPDASFMVDTDLKICVHERYLPIGSHSHGHLEMLCVVNGECAHRVGKKYGTLRAGEVLLVSPGTTHSFVPIGEDCGIINLLFKIETFEQKFQPVLHSQSVLSTFLLKTLYADSLNSYIIFHMGDYFRGDNKLAELMEQWFFPQAHVRERLNSYAQLFLLDMLDHHAVPPTVSIDMSASHKFDRAMTEYIRTHLATVTVQELSAVFSYSQRQIARVFKQSVGMTCTEYIQQCRQEMFLSLLVGSDMSISRAMELSGIRSPSQCYVTFRQQYGMSPADYRKKFNQFE